MHNYKEYDICYKKGKTMISPLAVRLRQKSLQVFLVGSRVPIILVLFPLWTVIEIAWIMHGLLNRWTSQLDLGSMTGGLERVVSVHNST